LKSGTCINTRYTTINTNDRPNINAHIYKARYGLPFYTMIMMVATIGGPTITMKPNPINIKKTQYFVVTSTKQINASKFW
jgi:hypothetical protein